MSYNLKTTVLFVFVFSIWMGCCCSISKKDKISKVDDLLHKLEIIDNVEKELVKSGPSILPELIANLNHKSPYVRIAVIYTLGEINDNRAVEPLNRLLEDPDFRIFQETAEALGKIGDDRSVEQLIKLWKHGEISRKGIIAATLGKIGNPRALPIMITSVQNEDPWLREIAACTLGDFKDPQAVKTLIAILDDKAWEVRYNAALSLGKIGDQSAIESLIDLLKDRDIRVRHMAHVSLKNISGKNFKRDYFEWRVWWEEFIIKNK